MDNHYVNNAQFLQAIKEYKLTVAQAKENNQPKPRVPRYLGECILKIATHLSYKSNFINYSYREEMISDGVENCLMYFDNFDPAKSNSPFAYFTQIAYFAFVRRIQKEKRQTLIKGHIIKNMSFDAFELQEHDEDGLYANSYLDFIQSHGVYDDLIIKEEIRKSKAKKKKQQPALDEFLETGE